MQVARQVQWSLMTDLDRTPSTFWYGVYDGKMDVFVLNVEVGGSTSDGQRLWNGSVNGERVHSVHTRTRLDALAVMSMVTAHAKADDELMRLIMLGPSTDVPGTTALTINGDWKDPEIRAWWRRFLASNSGLTRR